MKCDADRCGGPAAVVGDAARKAGGFPITGPISPPSRNHRRIQLVPATQPGGHVHSQMRSESRQILGTCQLPHPASAGYGLPA